MNINNKHPKPLFMMPLRRCGSHALRLRLNFNPEFYSPYPLHIVDIIDVVKLYGDLNNDTNYFQLIMDLIGLQNATMVKWKGITLDPVTIFEAIREHPRNIHRIVWEMLFQAGKHFQATVVMDKSLDSVHYAEEFVHLFDDIRFLNIVRDPRAQVNSMNKAIIYDFDTLLNATRWVKAHAAARSLIQKYPEKVLTIRFEDFISDQATVLRKICNFIGIAFSDTMLEISQSEEAKNLSQMSALWESNGFDPIPANVNKFKKSLTVDEITIIETLTADYMDLYGYEKLTPAHAHINDALFQEAHQKSTIKRQQAWEQLAKEKFYDYMLRKFRNDYIQCVRLRLLKKSAVTE